MGLPLQPQVFKAMAVVTHRVKCEAVESPDRSVTCRPRRGATAIFSDNRCSTDFGDHAGQVGEYSPIAVNGKHGN
jgi:hypothetical protein